MTALATLRPPVDPLPWPPQDAALPSMRVYVHLAYGFDACRWRERWARGDLLGINEQTPYGYHRASTQGCDLTFSRDKPEGRLGRLVRGGLRVLTGFDVVHAWRNRRRIVAAEVVWTHTESQHLAVRAVLKLLRVASPPPVVAQSVWLIDGWNRQPRWRRALYRWLLRDAELLTFHSPHNRAMAQALFPRVRCDVVPFGIDATLQDRPRKRSGGPVRILSVGNDRHRDWSTVLAAFGSHPGVEVRIASQTIDPRLVDRHPNVSIETPARNTALKALFAWCDILVLPLTPNHHASGITVMQEAALFGRPVVATRVGGLESYFADDAARYVPPGDADALRAAVEGLVADPDAALAMAMRAQARMSAEGLSSEAFVRRHVELSRELLGRTAPSDADQLPR